MTRRDARASVLAQSELSVGSQREVLRANWPTQGCFDEIYLIVTTVS